MDWIAKVAEYGIVGGIAVLGYFAWRFHVTNVGKPRAEADIKMRKTESEAHIAALGKQIEATSAITTSLALLMEHLREQTADLKEQGDAQLKHFQQSNSDHLLIAEAMNQLIYGTPRHGLRSGDKQFRGKLAEDRDRENAARDQAALEADDESKAG